MFLIDAVENLIFFHYCLINCLINTQKMLFFYSFKFDEMRFNINTRGS